MEFDSILGTPSPFLNKGLPPIPQEALELVDDIIDDAARVLGVGMRPTATQLRLLSENGWHITYAENQGGVNRKIGIIHTTKGLINYF